MRFFSPPPPLALAPPPTGLLRRSFLKFTGLGVAGVALAAVGCRINKD